MAPRGAEWSSGEPVDEQVRRESVGRKEEAARGMRTLAAGLSAAGWNVLSWSDGWRGVRRGGERASESQSERAGEEMLVERREMECSWMEHSSDWKRWNSWEQGPAPARDASRLERALRVRGPRVHTRDFFSMWR